MRPIPSFAHRLAFASLALLALASGAARAASLTPADWRGDARALVASVDSLHPAPYRAHHRAAFDSAAADLEQRLPAMRYDQAVAGFESLLALLRDGHSRLAHIELPSHGRPLLAPLPGPGFGATYPFDADVFADGLWITRAPAAHRELLGTHVVAVGHRAMPDVLAALVPVIPADNAMWTLYLLPAFLRTPGYAAAAGLVDGPDAPLVLTLADARGRRRDVTLGAERSDSTTRWLAADEGVAAPLPMTRSLPGPFAFADVGDSARTVFVRVRAIVDDPGGESMAGFVARLFAHADSLDCRRLVLDLRGNAGGNGYLNQPLVHAILRRPALDRTGALFVIVDRGTFSAAAMLAADLQRETHALFVGEPTGAAPNSPGDPARVTLPASGLVARISTVLWNSSDPRDPRAFIAPDLAAPLAWADWLAHRDPALAAIEAWRAAPDARDAPPNQHWGAPAQLHATPPAIAW